MYKLDEKAWYARHLIFNVLDVDVPMISAVNGPCNMHSEVPLMGDIVLASEDAYFQDASHFPRGQVPGDGQHVIWSFLAGHTRARYFLLTGKKLSAQEAKEWGVVNEVLPKDQLLDRAWELARELVKRPPLTLRYSRQLFTNPLKRAFIDELGHGLARETYAQRAFFPFGGEMEPLDRPWDQQPWSPANGTAQGRSPVSDQHPAEARHRPRQVHHRLPRTRHRPGELRGLHLRGVLRRRAQGGVRAQLVVRRADQNACRARVPTSPASCRAGWRRS